MRFAYHYKLRRAVEPANLIVSSVLLQQMPGISQPQKKFLITLFSTILLVYGKVNFTNLSRYSCLSEKTYRRHFLKSFNFPQFNQYFLEKALNPEHTVIAVIDCSFLTIVRTVFIWLNGLFSLGFEPL